MAVEIANLVAAINPDVYCEKSFTRDWKKLSSEVKNVAKNKGYLEAAKIAKLTPNDFIDIVETQFGKGAFALTGLKNPVERHRLIYDATSQNLESVYFWILDYMKNDYEGVDKLVDNFVSAVGSGMFGEMGQRATRVQEEAIKMFGTANTVLRSVLNIIYDLKEFKLRLAQYDDYKSKDERKKSAALLSLKQIWIDNVDIKRGNSAVKVMAQQFDFVTLLDAFMTVRSLADVDKLDLNERVKRILQQRYSEFERWMKESEQELRKRFEIEKIYLKSQVNSLKLYARWIKPYLRAAQQLEQSARGGADVVNLFNTSVVELVIMGRGKYDPQKDVDAGVLPREILKQKTRKYIPVTIVEFRFRTIPDRVDQRGGYNYRGRVEVTFTGIALNEDELKVFQNEIARDDVGDAYRYIAGATDESIGELSADIKDLLGEDFGTGEEKKKEEKKEDLFASVFSFFKVDEKEVKKEPAKGIPPDNQYEKVLRSQAILEARNKTRNLYNTYKKLHGMPAFRP